MAPWMSRLTFFLGTWIRHGDWYPDRKLRVFKREKATWGGSPEHDKIVLAGDGPTTLLAGDLRHYSFKDIGHYLHKHVHYSDVFLQRERDAGKRFSLFKVIARPAWRFFRGMCCGLASWMASPACGLREPPHSLPSFVTAGL